MNSNIGIDFEWNPNTVISGQLGEEGLSIDFEHLVISVLTQNAGIRVELSSGGLINLHIDIKNRYENITETLKRRNPWLSLFIALDVVYLLKNIDGLCHECLLLSQIESES